MRGVLIRHGDQCTVSCINALCEALSGCILETLAWTSGVRDREQSGIIFIPSQNGRLGLLKGPHMIMLTVLTTIMRILQVTGFELESSKN